MTEAHVGLEQIEANQERAKAIAEQGKEPGAPSPVKLYLIGAVATLTASIVASWATSMIQHNHEVERRAAEGQIEERRRAEDRQREDIRLIQERNYRRSLAELRERTAYFRELSAEIGSRVYAITLWQGAASRAAEAWHTWRDSSRLMSEQMSGDQPGITAEDVKKNEGVFRDEQRKLSEVRAMHLAEAKGWNRDLNRNIILSNLHFDMGRTFLLDIHERMRMLSSNLGAISDFIQRAEAAGPAIVKLRMWQPRAEQTVDLVAALKDSEKQMDALYVAVLSFNHSLESRIREKMQESIQQNGMK